MIVYEQSQQIDGGYRLGETETHYLDAMKMIFNWRLCMTPKDCPLTIDRSWCYRGTGSLTLLAIHAAVRLWALDGGDEPIGWIKNVNTGEHRESLSWQQLVERYHADAP